MRLPIRRIFWIWYAGASVEENGYVRYRFWHSWRENEFLCTISIFCGNLASMYLRKDLCRTFIDVPVAIYRIFFLERAEQTTKLLWSFMYFLNHTKGTIMLRKNWLYQLHELYARKWSELYRFRAYMFHCVSLHGSCMADISLFELLFQQYLENCYTLKRNQSRPYVQFKALPGI